MLCGYSCDLESRGSCDMKIVGGDNEHEEIFSVDNKSLELDWEGRDLTQIGKDNKRC